MSTDACLYLTKHFLNKQQNALLESNYNVNSIDYRRKQEAPLYLNYLTHSIRKDYCNLILEKLQHLHCLQPAFAIWHGESPQATEVPLLCPVKFY